MTEGGTRPVLGGLADREAALVGREQELALVRAALDRGGCVLVGAAGVGKSRLAREGASLFGGPLVGIVATAAAGSIPFGAFAHLLTAAGGRGPGPIAACLQALGERAVGGHLTLLVDDAHLLDEASAALVLSVSESGTARVLLTVRHGEPVPDAVTTLWKERRVDRLDLGPLSRRELRRLVDVLLGAQAEPDVHAKAYSMTRGNPLYTRELLIDAARSGALAFYDGAWRWTGRPPRMIRLADLIATRTHALSPAGRLAFELLAVGAPLRLDELAAASSEEGVAELERAGLATAGSDTGSPVMDLAHPLFGEVTLSSLPAATARGHRRTLAAALARTEPTDAFDVLRLAALKLESGERDPELFVRAGRHALQVAAGVPGAGWAAGDPELAVRLADAAGPRLDAELCGARGRMALSRFAEVEKRLAPIEEEAARAPLPHAAEYLRTRVYSLHWRNDPRGTPAALALLDRAAQWRRGSDWQAEHATLRAWILLDRARPVSAVRALGKLPSRADLPDQIRLDALLVLGVALGRLGLVDRCEAIEPQVLRLVRRLEQDGAETGWASHLVDGMARVEAARDVAGVAARLAAARQRAEARGDVALAAATAMVLGRLALIRGHVRDAVTQLEDAAADLTAGDPRNALGLTLTYLARAHALSGDPAKARVAVQRAEEAAAERPSNLRLQLEVERARAWSDAAGGRLAAACDRLLAVADGANEGVMCEAESVYDALRLGAPAPPCALRLRRLAESAQNELLEAWAAHASALAEQDATAQLQAGKRFAVLGVDLLAAEATAGAGRAFSAAGLALPARRANALAATHAALCQGARSPSLTVPAGGDQLTPREREVAVLAARGWRNADIAQELVLSVRSVETYVLRACRKLGADSRSGLAELLAPTAD